MKPAEFIVPHVDNSTDGSECLVLERNAKADCWHAPALHVAILPAKKQLLAYRKISAPESAPFGHPAFDPNRLIVVGLIAR